jgi:hypothetical protein
VESLINAIMLWLSLNFALPLVPDQPTIRHVARGRIAAIHYGGVSGRHTEDRSILGVYDAPIRAQRFGAATHTIPELVGATTFG